MSEDPSTPITKQHIDALLAIQRQATRLLDTITENYMGTTISKDGYEHKQYGVPLKSQTDEAEWWSHVAQQKDELDNAIARMNTLVCS